MINQLTHEKILDVINNLKISSDKKFKLFVVTGLLGDFDSIEYAKNLVNFIQTDLRVKNIDIFLIAIGSNEGKEKFCYFTGFPEKNLILVNDNTLHASLGTSSGINSGLGGWTNMLLMLSGINSFQTIKEVIRGYTGDKNAKQLFASNSKITIFDSLKLPTNLFDISCGKGYLRPFELATFRLVNMIEIFRNWEDYILDINLLPQRGATILLNEREEILYKYFPKNILGYSENMAFPLEFIEKNID